MKFNILYILVTIGLLYSCQNTTNKQNKELVSEPYNIEYAQGFAVNKYDKYTEVIVYNPWDSGKVLQNYILVDKALPLPDHLPQGTLIRTPISSVITYSTLHCSVLNELESTDIITGVCEPEYVRIPQIQEGLETGKIVSLGMASKPDIEKMILLSPDAILASPITGQTYGEVVKTRIPIIETPDYTEPHPLGRAEWIRFQSLFIGKEQLADSLFAITKQKYNAVKDIVAKSDIRPSVFLDKKFQTSWNISGGKSYMAKMLKDAGGEYVWENDESTTFMPLSFETVLDKAGDADIWLIRYYDPKNMTYTSLKKEYNPYSHFKSYKKNNIWGCNTYNSKFYEDLPIHPELILKDFASVFNPSLFPDYTPRYFVRLEK